MKCIDLSAINDSLEDLLVAKIDIENYLIEKGTIEKKYTIPEFLEKLNIENTIYLDNGTVISFKILNSAKDKYLFYTGNNITENMIKTLISKLISINYDYTKLTKKTTADMVNENMLEKQCFVINNEYYA